MGVDIYVFRFLMNFKSPDLGDSLCLGRQGLHIYPNTRQWESAQQILAAVDPGRQFESFRVPGGFADTFLKYLGARSVLSMDNSRYEGAEILHDLNKPVPPDMKDRFDFILDGGTLEHIYNFPVAVDNIKFMLRPGGLFIGISPANNQLGHGFYQFSPDLFWRVYSPDAGFTVEKMQLVPLSSAAEPIDLVDKPGTRQEIGATPHATYVMVAARRALDSSIAASDIYQTDYEATWKRRS